MRFALEHRFDHIQIEGEHGFGKPEERAYYHAMETLGVGPHDTWMVGDNLEWEVVAPQRLGIHAIWHDGYGVGLPPDCSIRPDRIIRPGKGEKTGYLPLHPGTNELIHYYLDAAGHGEDENGPLFRPIRNNRTGRLDKALDPDMVYRLVRGNIQRNSASRSAPTRCGRRPPPMRSIIRPTSPRCRSGSATPTSAPPASMIIARSGRRTARHSKWRIDQVVGWTEARTHSRQIPGAVHVNLSPIGIVK